MQHKCICGLQNTLIVKKTSSSSVISWGSLDFPVFCYSQWENEVLPHGHKMAATTQSSTSSHGSFPKRRNSSFMREKTLCQKLPIELLLRCHWPELGHVSTTKPRRFGKWIGITTDNLDQLWFILQGWTHCLFLQKNKAGEEMFVGQKQKPAVPATTGRWATSDIAWVVCEAITWRCWEAGWPRCQTPSEKNSLEYVAGSQKQRNNTESIKLKCLQGPRLVITLGRAPGHRQGSLSKKASAM